MYSHVFVRLKARFGLRPGDLIAMRRSVDAAAKTKLKGYISEVLNFDAPGTTFAWKLAHPIAKAEDLPAAIREVLESSPKVLNYSPAVITRKSSTPALVAPATYSMPDSSLELPSFDDAPAPESAEVPAFDEILTGFHDLISLLPDDYQIYGLKLQPFRAGCMPPRELATAVRDSVAKDMEAKGKWLDRSFTAKRMNEENQAKLVAEATAAGAGPDAIKTAQTTKLPNRTFHLDMSRTVGFWSADLLPGGGSIVDDTKFANSARGRAQAEADTRAAAGQADARARFVDRVLLVKIGEVFLKKGNRSKFVTQLQYNLQHKIGSRGVVKREHHNFLIVPPAPAAGSKQAYFSDEDLSVLTDAVRCVPGIDIVNAVIRTGTDMASMITAIQYLTAIASASQESDITAHTPAAAPSIVKSPSDARAAAAALFAPAAERLAAGTTADELLLRSRARASMLSVTRLGFKLDVHLHEPCPYKSKTTLNKELTMAARRETQLMLGLTTQIPHPGRAYYEEKDIEDAAEARKREDLVAEFEAERAKWLATDEGSAAAKAEAEAERKTAVSSMTDADAMKDEAEDEEDGEHKSSWIAPRSGVSVRVDVTESSALIGFYAGPDYVDAIGGQPTATGAETQTVVVLLSGGMDSPVAAFSMMRRGMRVILVHFQNANLADEDTVKHKIVQLAEQLSRYQVTTYLHIVPFSAIQDAIIMEVPSPARMLVYRRFMFHVASLVATKYNARFLVLGDALGQVASQTASNLFASYINAPLPILSPLVGTNKREIMAVAQQIGTYDISALPYGDCCSYFLAKHPLTRIRPEVLASYESAVGSKSPGGAVQLVKSAHLAAAILRWNKPDEPMETVKEAQPVASVYHEEVSKLLAACPMRPKDDGEADGTGDGEGEGAAAIVAEASYPLVEPSPAAGSPANADAEVSAEPRVKRSRAALDVASDSIMGATKTSGYNPNALSRLSAGVSAETVAAAQAAAEAAEAAGENAPLTAVASLSAAVALPAPRGAVARAYLDNAATTPLHPVVLSAMLPYLGGAAFGNPSSAHNAGLGAKAIVEEARRVVLGLINAPLAVAGQTSAEAVAAADAAASTTSGKPGRKMKDQLLAFTSGGTEANSLALIGSARAAVERHSASVRDAAMHIAATRASQGNGTGSASVYTHVRVHYITSPLEHSAILEAIRSIERSPLTLAVGTGLTTSAGGSLTVDVNVKVSVAVTYLRNNKSGVVDVDHLKYALSQDISRASTAAAAAASSDTVSVAPESNVVFSEACFPPEPTPVMTVVSLMHANNEVGTIQPLARIGAAVAAHRTSAASVPPVVFHTDACQSFAKVHLDVQECQLDLVSLNGHKVHGPKGVGALYIRPGITVAPLIVGGGHEGGIRPGTINVPGVVGFAAGAAHFLGAETCLINPALSPLPLTAPVVRAADAPARMTSALVSARPGAPLPSLKGAMMRIIKEIRDVFPRAQVNGGLGTLVSLGNISDVPTEPRDEAEPALPHVLSVLLDRSGWMDSGAIIKFLSARGVAVSMGSACATNSEPAPSHVLLGLDMRPEQANATVRISIGSLTTEAEVDALVSAIRELAQAKEGQFKVQGGR